MNLIRFLFRAARGLMIFTTIAAVVSGACNTGLIALVNFALKNPAVSAAGLVWTFVALGLGKLATNFVSQVTLARYSQAAIAGLRQDLVQKILAVPL
ncbi:MAG: ABC transporter ATP-binding protein, partial [Verrucomicrobia bacterium]